LLIEKLKLTIKKLQHEQFGRSSERGALLDQLELQLAELTCVTTVRLPAQIRRRPCSSIRPIVAVRIRSSTWPAMPD
jgi:hypothetical protein